MTPIPTSHSAILRMAIPIILANAATPLLGLVDTAVISHGGSLVDLGGIALGALVFSFVYWGFGFLRMGTSGFTAQAAGAGDDEEVRAAFARALFMGVAIGVLLLFLQVPLRYFALWLLSASESVEQQFVLYWDWRIWGAPAVLANYAVMGALIGLGKTRVLLGLQLLLNGVNLGLDVLFVMGFGWGIQGIALGTLIAEWLCFLVGFKVLLGVLGIGLRESFWPWARIRHARALLDTLNTNTDIMWRTLCLLAGFGWFVNQSAVFGDVTLAANHVLLQFISLSAFFLDGYAFALESLVGRAIGARNRTLFDRVIRVATELSAITALGLAALVFFVGPYAIGWLTPDAQVQAAAQLFLPLAALYVLCSFVAFQLDGVFIGATQSRAMRDTAVYSLLVFLGLSYWWVAIGANQGLWCAFIAYVIARAVFMGLYLPRLRQAKT